PSVCRPLSALFLLNTLAPPRLSPLSLHDALPILPACFVEEGIVPDDRSRALVGGHLERDPAASTSALRRNIAAPEGGLPRGGGRVGFSGQSRLAAIPVRHVDIEAVGGIRDVGLGSGAKLHVGEAELVAGRG